MRSGAFVLAGLVAAGIGGFAWIHARATRSGDVFPRFSSLRPDPLGTRALHDALERLPGMNVARWYRPTRPDLAGPAAVLWLGVPLEQLTRGRREDLVAWEEMAKSGSRVVIALHWIKPVDIPLPLHKEEKDPKSELRARWGIEAKTSGALVYFELASEEWKTQETIGEHAVAVSRKFGKGDIAIVNASSAFTNATLASDDRKTDRIAWAIGDHRRVVFDEHHLGTEMSGSVGTMMRRHGLTAAFGVLVLWFGLFVWRMTTGFLPPAPPAPVSDTIAGRDSAAALASLLRRHVPASGLASTALTMMRQSAPLLTRIPVSRRREVEALLAAPSEKPADTWVRAHRILHPNRTEKTNP